MLSKWPTLLLAVTLAAVVHASANSASSIKPYTEASLVDPNNEGEGACKASVKGTLQDVGSVETGCQVSWSEEKKKVRGRYNDTTPYSSVTGSWSSCQTKAMHNETIHMGDKEIGTKTVVDHCGHLTITVDVPADLHCEKQGTKWVCKAQLQGIQCDDQGNSQTSGQGTNSGSPSTNGQTTIPTTNTTPFNNGQASTGGEGNGSSSNGNEKKSPESESSPKKDDTYASPKEEGEGSKKSPKAGASEQPKGDDQGDDDEDCEDDNEESGNGDVDDLNKDHQQGGSGEGYVDSPTNGGQTGANDKQPETTPGKEKSSATSGRTPNEKKPDDKKPEETQPSTQQPSTQPSTQSPPSGTTKSDVSSVPTYNSGNGSGVPNTTNKTQGEDCDEHGNPKTKSKGNQSSLGNISGGDKDHSKDDAKGESPSNTGGQQGGNESGQGSGKVDGEEKSDHKANPEKEKKPDNGGEKKDSTEAPPSTSEKQPSGQEHQSPPEKKEGSTKTDKNQPTSQQCDTYGNCPESKQAQPSKGTKSGNDTYGSSKRAEQASSSFSSLNKRFLKKRV